MSNNDDYLGPKGNASPKAGPKGNTGPKAVPLNNNNDYNSDDEDINEDIDEDINEDIIEDINEDIDAPLKKQNIFKESKILDDKKKDFDGSIGYKNNWVQCLYCTKYHPKSMHLPNVDYCGHCWGWLHNEQLQLTEGKYTGTHTLNEIKTFLKQTYPLHPLTCTNTDCVYNKISLYNKTNKLHLDFCLELGFVNPEKNNPQKKSEYKIKKNNTNTRINFKSSSISI